MLARWLIEALSFDLETTGTDVFKDRVVTGCAVHVGEAGATFRGRWLLNPGVSIPAEATAVHGISTEKARADGMDPQLALESISMTLTEAWRSGLPVVICNAHFDLTMLQAELARYRLPALAIGAVLDPLCIDRAMDPYRKGKRTLTALAAHYKVQQDAAHSSDGDALTAARVVWRQARVFTHLADHSLEQMHALQQKAHADWAVGFERYLRAQGKDETINREWPVRTAPAAAEGVAA